MNRLAAAVCCVPLFMLSCMEPGSSTTGTVLPARDILGDTSNLPDGAADTFIEPDVPPADTVDTPEVSGPPRYYAVSISDPATIDCSNNSGNHGADLDAVELVDGFSQVSVGFVTQAKGFLGDGKAPYGDCSGSVNTANQEISNVYGPPDGGLSGGFIPLAGGYINVSFSQELVPVYEIQLYEVGADECGDQGCKDDSMIVGLVTDLDCELYDPSCYLALSSQAVGDAVIPLSGN